MFHRVVENSQLAPSILSREINIPLTWPPNGALLKFHIIGVHNLRPHHDFLEWHVAINFDLLMWCSSQVVIGS
jgi:hypothetical protein